MWYIYYYAFVFMFEWGVVQLNLLTSNPYFAKPTSIRFLDDQVLFKCSFDSWKIFFISFVKKCIVQDG